MADTMRAVVLDAPGPVENLQIRDLPVPEPRPGWVRSVFDGGYAEYTVVPRDQVVPFTSDLPWHLVGAVPETLQTAYGSLTTDLPPTVLQGYLDRLAAAPPASDRTRCTGSRTSVRHTRTSKPTALLASTWS